MESRKRSHSHDGDPVVLKKHIISSANGSPRVNGVNAEADYEEPNESTDLELFRKEAIYRRMKHYSRENDRNQARIAELERRKSTCEAGLVALSACWTQLVETIKTLAKAEELPPMDHRAKEAFDVRSYLSESPSRDIKAVLEESKQATHSLVTRFVQLGGQQGSGILHDETYLRYQAAKSESAALRNELSVVHARLQDAEKQSQKYHDELQASQNRCERLQSKSILAQQPRGQEVKGTRPTEMEDEVKHRSSPEAPPNQHQANGTAALDGNSKNWEEISTIRQNEITAYQNEIVQLQERIRTLEAEVKIPSLAIVGESAHYKNLMDKAARVQHEANEDRAKAEALTAELKLLTQKATEDNSEREYSQIINDLKATITRRDADLARLRETRDQQAAELKERKEKDNWKETSLNELKSLNRAQEERISILQSHLQRAKAQIAAKVGDAEMMQFFLIGSSQDVDIVAHLKRQLDDVTSHASALEESLNHLQATNPENAELIRQETRTREQLADVTAQLHKYQAVYGESSALSPDMADLASKLKDKEEELQRLRLMNSQREETESSLYAEVDKLSAAWEALEKQVKSKVFDLVGTEEKMTKQQLERAKAENKFYAAMREKEAVDSERKALLKNVEKQAKALERCAEIERNLTAQVNTLEAEVQHYSKAAEDHRATIRGMDQALDNQKRLGKEIQAKVSEIQRIAADRERVIMQEKSKLQVAQEQLVVLRNEVERERASLKTAVAKAGKSAKSPATEQDPMVADLMALVKCSTCKGDVRKMVITKCGHSFCKNCIETRIATRQRKCPSCNVPFAQSEAVNLYLQ